MTLTFSILSAFTLVLGLQLTNIYVAAAATGDIHSLTQIQEYEPPNEGGPDSSQGSGTR
ncbi:hypothetical protein ACE1B6_29505 [Aerosakkonemataceae cyanobacterium BLCC-F154]|uniref:Uncharacterized protein n=1 Tax=Floridaenema fluviatile BLCC-F154 TaxID=3153640 RepID=A0ABV4YKP3_9CYAN